jgi:hypothetical protein
LNLGKSKVVASLRIYALVLAKAAAQRRYKSFLYNQMLHLRAPSISGNLLSNLIDITYNLKDSLNDPM